MLVDVNRFRMFPETLMAYRGHAIALTGVHGLIRNGIEGLYLHQTRFVSHFTFRVDGQAPRFVSANAVDTYSFISYYYAPNPAGKAAGPGGHGFQEEEGEIVDKGIEIQLNRFVGEGFHHDLLLTNRALGPATIELSFHLAADFADLNACIEGRPTLQAPVEVSWQANEDGGSLNFHCTQSQLDHGTLVHFHPLQEGPEFRDDRVIYRLHLEPQRTERFCIEVVPIFLGRRYMPLYGCDAFRSADTPWDRATAHWVDDMASIEASNPHVQVAWNRAVSDLASLPLLDGRGDQIFTPAAGVPSYQALFGRDTLTTAWQSSMLAPQMLTGTIETIAARLGRRYDDTYDEQPGRVIHQRQFSPLSLLGKNPYLHYYGDYAGPGMFLIAIAWHFAMTGDRDFVRGLRGPIRQVLDWMDRDGDRDGDGFYEYDTRAGAWGTKNQGWKDSVQAMLYPDGGMVENPIAPCEIQGYVYCAKQLLGLTYLALGDWGLGTDLLAQADDLKRRFNAAYWLPEERFYALALDADKRPVGTIASNPGHCLACGIIDADKAAVVAERLMAPDMFSGWGIRTLSSQHPAFNPFSYHLGSVWPSENATIALGFKRYGLDDLVQQLAKGLIETTHLYNLNRLPEVIGGHQRDKLHPHPGIYPHSNAPQAWSSSSVVLLFQMLLGLVPLAPIRTLLLDPALPAWLPELTVRDLHVGPARVSLHFSRDARGHTDYQVLANPDGVRIVRQAPPNALSVGVFGRLGQALGSLKPARWVQAHPVASAATLAAAGATWAAMNARSR